MPQSGSYYYPGSPGATRPSIDVNVVSGSTGGGVTSTVTFGGTAQPITGSVALIGTPTVAITGSRVPLSGASFQNSSSFTGGSYNVIFGPIDLSLCSNFALTIVNNAATSLVSASLEWSPNNSQYEQWDTTSFAGLAAGGILSMQVSSNSRKWFRIRAIATNGSTDIYINANNG
jgi:hypothetical protein